MGDAVRWVVAVLVGGVVALVLVIAVGAALAFGAGCTEAAGNCAVGIQLAPLAFILVWIALTIFLSRALR